MSGNFVCERQRIVYIYNIHVYYICKQYVAARAQNFQYIIHVNNTLPLAHKISRHFWAAYGIICSGLTLFRKKPIKFVFLCLKLFINHFSI